MDAAERLNKILKEDKNSYTMKEIMTTMVVCFDGYEKGSKTAASVKSKITQGEWNSLINGIMMSFFMSLHASKLSPEEAIKLADTEGVFGVAVVEAKKR